MRHTVAATCVEIDWTIPAIPRGGARRLSIGNADHEVAPVAVRCREVTIHGHGENDIRLVIYRLHFHDVERPAGGGDSGRDIVGRVIKGGDLRAEMGGGQREGEGERGEEPHKGGAFVHGGLFKQSISKT